MTDNQRIAIDRLTEYRDAKLKIRSTKQKVAVIEAKCNKVTRAPDSIMQDSGKRDDKGNKIYVPMVVQHQMVGNSREGYLDQLMDMKSEYWQQCVDAERLCMEIEREIQQRCSGVRAVILSMHYLYNQSLERISVSINYCYAQTKRHKWMALEEFGEKMSHDEP